MDDVAIRIDDVSKDFKLPHEKVGSVKNLFVNLFRYLTKKRSYETQHALHNVSFDIKTGEFFGIVGRNGSGKSTLLKMIAGIYQPNKGKITVNGKLVPFIELGVGFNPELTGRENVYLNGALLGFSEKEMQSMYKDIVDFAELERFMDQKLKNYSSGMQVRLAFSVAIRARSDILLIDEVLAVGDSAFQQKCFDYFEKLKAEKKTVVFVSHSMDAVTRFCTEAVYIKDGELVSKGPAADIAEIYKLENIEAPVPAAGVGPKLSEAHSLKAEITGQTKNSVDIGFSYKSEDEEKMYVGISIIKDGISFAELRTSPKKPLIGSGTATYSLDTGNLNAGIYQITAVLCRLKGKKLLAVPRKATKFKIEGEDDNRGSALKLADTWKY